MTFAANMSPETLVAVLRIVSVRLYLICVLIGNGLPEAIDEPIDGNHNTVHASDGDIDGPSNHNGENEGRAGNRGGGD